MNEEWAPGAITWEGRELSDWEREAEDPSSVSCHGAEACCPGLIRF